MSEVTKVRRCYGCGEVLQSEDPNLPGYADPWEMERHEIVLCDKCFREQHASKQIINEPVLSRDFRQILDRARTNKSLIVYVVDLLTFETSFISEVRDAIRDNPLILVANKFDLLPAKTKADHISEYVAKRCEDAHLKPAKIILASAARNYNIDEVLDALRELGVDKNIYFIGSLSSGKSALVNALLKIYKNPTKFYISTSIYPNTTLKVIEIPIDATHAMYDTPGLSLSNSLIGKMASEREVIKSLVPRHQVTPRWYYLRANDVLIFGGLAMFQLISGSKTHFGVYMSSDVEIHRTITEHANDTFARLIRRNETHPISTSVNSSVDLDVYDIRVDYDAQCDISFAGLGWISFVGQKQVIRCYVPKGVSIYHGKAKI